MVERKILVLAVLVVLVGQVLSIGLIVPESAFAFGPPPPILAESHFDLDTAKNFENVGYIDSDEATILEFVLERGTTGTINITISSKENMTVLFTLNYGGVARKNYSARWPPNNIPDGIAYSIEPSSNITLAANSTVTETLRISATPDTAIRSYKLTFISTRTKGSTTLSNEHLTILTIVDGISSSSTNTSNITRITASYVTQTTTLTSTTTKTTIIERTIELSVYAWAIGATIIASTFVVLLGRRNRTF